MNYIDIIPLDLQEHIFKLCHQQYYNLVLKQIVLFDNTTLLDINNCYLNDYHFTELLTKVNDMEYELYNAINQNRYTNVLINTNIPKNILIKTCGKKYETIIYDVVSATSKLPNSLRKYILYNKKPNAKRYNLLYCLKAKPNHELICLKNFPGGLESWSYYNNSDFAELMDLSKHQWNYLDYDIQINKLSKHNTVKDKLDYIKICNIQTTG